MTLTEWRTELERRIAYARMVHSSAPIADVLLGILGELDQLELNGKHEEPKADRMLRAPEVAQRLGISQRSVYKSATAWPFTRRYPSGSLRFSELGLERWLTRQR